MFCDNCGAPVDEGMRFCDACGAPVSLAAHTAGATPANTPSQPIQVRSGDFATTGSGDEELRRIEAEETRAGLVSGALSLVGAVVVFVIASFCQSLVGSSMFSMSYYRPDNFLFDLLANLTFYPGWLLTAILVGVGIVGLVSARTVIDEGTIAGKRKEAAKRREEGKGEEAAKLEAEADKWEAAFKNSGRSR